MPGRVGLVSGVFFGFAFVYQLCSYLPAIGLVAWLLPNLERERPQHA